MKIIKFLFIISLILSFTYSQTIEVRVSNSSDDAEEKVNNGSMYRNSSDLELTKDGSKQQIIGIRFQNISIPKNATITNAYIQFSVDEKSSEATNLIIHGEATDSANSFSNSHYDISHRAKTTSSITWSPPAWNRIHQEGVNQRTPNLKDIVQEIINRDGWHCGNAMSFIISGSGKRVAESYDGGHTIAPLLHIEYSGGDNNSSTTATCYALTDNSDKLYKVTMNPSGGCLPTALTVNISTNFNGEGSAYRASNNKFYAFKATSDNYGPSDLYSIDVDTGTTTKIVDNIISGTVDGAEFYFNPTLNREILYIISGENNSKLYAFDPNNNWLPLDGYPKNTNTGLSSLAINPINGVAYAIDDYNYDHKKPKMYKLNLETGATTYITTLQNLADAEGLAFASDGNLYIEDEGRYELNGKKLYMVNLQTGELTPAAITNSNGDIEGLSCNGTQMAIDNPIIKLNGNSSVVEGDSGITNLVFPITLNRPATKDILLHYEITDIDTIANNDYILDNPLTVSIPKNANSGSITVKVKGDTDVENNESFALKLIDATNAIVDSSSAIGTIINDDNRITVAIEKSVSIEEGDIGDKDLTFNIILDRPAPNGGVTVQIQPHNITANEGEDYTRNSSSINFNQGEIRKSISYTIHGDYKVEDNETFSVELHNPQNAILDINRSRAIGTIINDDREPKVSIEDANITEGDSRTKRLNFTVKLDIPAPNDSVTVQVQPHNITALEGEDYRRVISSIHFAKGDSSKTIYYLINGDTKVEDNETFRVELHNPQNAILDSNRSEAIGTIIDDDSEDIEPELLSNYHFDKCSWSGNEGEVKDSSANGLNGVSKNGANTTDINISNRGAKFISSSHQYLKFNGFDNILGPSSNSFTITAWIRPTSLSDRHTNHATKNTFIAKASDNYNDNLEIGVNPNGTIHLYLDTKVKDRYANFGNAGDITLNSWHFIGVSYNKGVVTVQIDNKTYIDNSTWNGATKIDSAINSPLTIGSSIHVDNFFDGYVDEVTIFRTPMTPNQMLNIRNFNLNGKDWSGADITPYDCRVEPIGCLQTAFMFQNRPTDINVLNLVNGDMVPAVNNISNDNINAVGFNKKDGYFWGYNYTKRNGTVTRIGMDSQGNWVSRDFKVSGLEGFASYVGDIDSSGKLYLKAIRDSKRVVVIDLDKNSSTYLQKIREFDLTINLNTADWAFNARDNMLYAVNNGSNSVLKKLYQIDPSNGQVTVKGDTLLRGNRGFGAGFFDADGFYYVYDNYSGNIYRIDVANSSKAVLFATADKVTLNDGAMCTDAEFKFDFGDLPDNYPTKLESDGARHSLPTYGDPTIYLGNGVSSESNGKPSESANLDESDDGVKINNLPLQNKTINAGESSTLKITTHGEGFLNAWIDWNGDGDFNDEGEQIADNIDGSSGEIVLTINPPATATDIVTYARFRYSYQQDLLPTGPAIDGEVEDYKINIHGNLEPFSCNDTMYLSNRTATGLDEDNSGATWLHKFRLPNLVYRPIGEGFTSSDYGYNAIGYNIQDNFIYALYGNHLLKIDANAVVKDLGAVQGLPAEQLYAGEFDRDGYYYVAGVNNPDDKLYKIDIAQKRVIKTISLKYSERGHNESVKFLDMAIDSSNQYFYAMLLKSENGVYENSKFVKIDKSSGVMTVLGDEFEDMDSYSNLIFSDKNGKVITITKSGDVYELEPSTGKDYLIIQSSNAIGNYNDGTSCPNAEFILPPHLPRLSIGDVAMAEGDSGETIFRFKVSIDADLPMVPMGMPAIFYYRIIDGNGNDITPPHGVALQSDNDFQGAEGIGINMNIFSESRETYIEVPVYGDTKVEKDEEFYVDIYFPQFFPTNFCLMGKSRGVGLILNDDLKFDIIRTNANIDDKLIYTQIAGRDFDYSIISSKGGTPSPINNLTIKVKLIDNSSGKTLYEGYKYIDGESRVDVVDNSDLKLLDVTRDAIFKVYFIRDSNGTILHGNYANRDSYNAILNQIGFSEINQDASEHFSIRPAGYRVYIKDIGEDNNTVTYRDSSYNGSDSLKLSAGYSYIIEAEAVALDSGHSKTKGYTTITNNEINATLIFKDKHSCRDKSNVPLNNYHFNNSHLIGNISHSNIGKYQLHIEDKSWSSADGAKGSCIIGSSAISTDGNSKSGCSISSTTLNKYKNINLQFYPYRFNITNISLRNRPDNGRDYIYMSDLDISLDMGVLLSANIIAEDKNGNRATNFTSSCEAFDTSLYLKYHITTDRIDNQLTYDKIYTIKGSEVGFKRVISYNQESFNSVENIHLDNAITIPANKFLDANDGNISINILFNLNKNLSEPINPIKLEFNSLDINSSNSSKIKNIDRVADGTQDIDGSKLFYFASIAPDRENYEDVYERHAKTPISALIFCDKNISWCSTMIGDNGLNGIRTKDGWYRAYLHNANTDGKVINFIIDNPLVEVTPSANHLPNFTNGKIEDIITGYSGDNLPAKVEVKMDLSPWLKYHREPSRNGIPFWRNRFRDSNATLSGVGKTGQILETSTTRVAKKIEW